MDQDRPPGCQRTDHGNPSLWRRFITAFPYREKVQARRGCEGLRICRTSARQTIRTLDTAVI